MSIIDIDTLTDDERAAFAADHQTPRVITHAEDVGNLDRGPVVIVHGLLDEIGGTYAHAFGPFRDIRTALQAGPANNPEDDCVKSIVVLLSDEDGLALIDIKTMLAAAEVEALSKADADRLN